MNEDQVTGGREEFASAKEERRQEIEKAFDPNRMKVIRKELFANLREPAVTIRDGNITFNTACINGLEDVVCRNALQLITYLLGEWLQELSESIHGLRYFSVFCYRCPLKCFNCWHIGDSLNLTISSTILWERLSE